ncbi:MAG: hypothetical protein LBP42_00730 [Treponema sp.]|jgi:drug/metabolite transporter (DMT)-like permease|nr:hypothetical protein [Treponema sp.]
MAYAGFLSQPAAILMALTAAMMWGTWFISLKYLGDYPLEAFYITLFAASFVFVWGLGIFLSGAELFREMSLRGAELRGILSAA